MSKPFRDEAVDQIAHFTIAMLAVATLSILGPDQPMVNGAIIGLWLGLVREYTEDKFKGAGWRTVMDVAFWTAGGAFAGAM